MGYIEHDRTGKEEGKSGIHTWAHDRLQLRSIFAVDFASGTRRSVPLYTAAATSEGGEQTKKRQPVQPIETRGVVMS